MENDGKTHRKMEVYPLVRVCITMEITIIHGKTHYFNWAMFNSELLLHQRVPNILEIIRISQKQLELIRD